MSTRSRIDTGVWREELRPRFRSSRISASKHGDYEWPPRTAGAANVEPAADRASLSTLQVS